MGPEPSLSVQCLGVTLVAWWCRSGLVAAGGASAVVAAAP